MKRIISRGDEIRVIAPSHSFACVAEEKLAESTRILNELGLKLTFGKRVSEIEKNDSASIEARVSDMRDAFLDKNVKGIMAAAGGFNVNQILDYIDYDAIAANPKPIFGFSDITALTCAIYAKTGVTTYHGPNLGTFSYDDARDYTIEFFKKCFMTDAPYEMTHSVNAGEYRVLQKGKCEGTIIGGNLCTLNLLQGTEYMPTADSIVLFLEDDNIMGEYFTPEFDRNLESLLQVYKERVSGIVFGRFTEDCGMTDEFVAKMIAAKRRLNGLPIITGADFGHICPMCPFPIGGKATIEAGEHAKIIIEG